MAPNSAAAELQHPWQSPWCGCAVVFNEMLFFTFYQMHSDKLV